METNNENKEIETESTESKTTKTRKSSPRKTTGTKTKTNTKTNDNITEVESNNATNEIDEIIATKKTKNNTNTEVVVIDSETSDVLERLKKQEVANKQRVVTSEEVDKNIVEEETVVDSNVERYLDTDITKGLTNEQVETRITEHLTNDVGNDKGKSILGIILSNVFTFFNMLYFTIAIVLIILKDYGNIFFLGVVIPNLLIGIYQEIKAKLTVDKMKIMSAPVATVIRDGQKLEIAVKDVVLDDIILYTTGKQICADSIVVDGNVEVNEALLTGEADAIIKTPGSKLFSGSFLSSGTCVARVDKIGKDSYIEKMSADAKKYNAPNSELLRTLRGVIKVITIGIFPIAILYMLSQLTGAFDLGDFLKNLPNSIKEVAYIILAMIPAGLFLLTSMALFVGVRRLAKNNTLVQELYCIEMLARVDVLCLDKTGTITDGTMRVCDCVEINNPTDYTIREIVGSMMNAFQETNPTSDALIKYFDKNNVLSATEVIPFSSKRKYSAVSFGQEGTFIVGAPDFVVKDNFEKIKSKVERFSLQGCRVLVLGYLNSKLKSEELPKNVKPLALIVIQDHIRDDASDTISFFKQNGVDIKVISGDNPETVSKIADRVGVENASRYINLNGLTDEEIENIIFDYTVFGRVTPSQKKVIVKALKKNGKTVAMTGDGVNDIPALKEADCSVAMASGSEATRYVSHLILMDSNFSSMPKVVNEGRRVINNIQKTSALYLTKNLFAVLLAVMYIIIGFSSKVDAIGNITYPFQSKHLMMIEFIILGLATLALSLQPNREVVKGKFLPNVIKEILPGAITIIVFQLILFFAQRINIGGHELFPQLLIKQTQELYSPFQTIAALETTLIMFIVLFEACRPFNGYRKILISGVIFLLLLAIFEPHIRNFLGLDFSQFGNSEWLLLIIFFQASYPVMGIIKWLLRVLHLVPTKNN